MIEKAKVETFISDSGIIENNKTKQARRFVFICNVLTLILVILGILAFFNGTI